MNYTVATAAQTFTRKTERTYTHAVIGTFVSRQGNPTEYTCEYCGSEALALKLLAKQKKNWAVCNSPRYSEVTFELMPVTIN